MSDFIQKAMSSQVMTNHHHNLKFEHDSHTSCTRYIPSSFSPFSHSI